MLWRKAGDQSHCRCRFNRKLVCIIKDSSPTEDILELSASYDLSITLPHRLLSRPAQDRGAHRNIENTCTRIPLGTPDLTRKPIIKLLSYLLPLTAMFALIKQVSSLADLAHYAYALAVSG